MATLQYPSKFWLGLPKRFVKTVSYHLFSLVFIKAVFVRSPLIAQVISLQPLADTLLFGNYCVTGSGISRKDAPHCGSFELFVPKTSAKSYWVWRGRSLPFPNQGDNSIKIGQNGLSTVEIFVDAQGDSLDSIRTWYSDVYTNTNSSFIQPLTTTFISTATAILDVQKTPDFQTMVSGESATFTISVQNVGDTTFDDLYVSNIVITNIQSPQCNASIERITEWGNSQYTCTQPNSTHNFTNTAEAGGLPSVGKLISAQGSANIRIVNPAVSVTNSPELQPISSISTALFTIPIENSSTIALTQVRATAPQVPSYLATVGTTGSSSFDDEVTLSIHIESSPPYCVDPPHKVGRANGQLIPYSENC